MTVGQKEKREKYVYIQTTNHIASKNSIKVVLKAKSGKTHYN